MSKFRDLWLRLYMIKQFLNDDNSIRQTDSAYQMPLREGVRVDLQTHTHTHTHTRTDTIAQKALCKHILFSFVHSKPEFWLTKMHAIYTL